jgi:hypothetical protein
MLFFNFERCILRAASCLQLFTAVCCHSLPPPPLPPLLLNFRSGGHFLPSVSEWKIIRLFAFYSLSLYQYATPKWLLTCCYDIALVTRSKCMGNSMLYLQIRAKSFAKNTASAQISVVGQNSQFRIRIQTQVFVIKGNLKALWINTKIFFS